jgi:hypothetical protein
MGIFLQDKHAICRYTHTCLTEDRATLGSDPSAVRTSEHGAVKSTALLYLLSCSEAKAINPSPPEAGSISTQSVALHIKMRHFKNSIGTADGFVDLLEGDVNFDAVKTALAEIGYDGYVTAELIPYQPGRPEKTAEAMKKIFR